MIAVVSKEIRLTDRNAAQLLQRMLSSGFTVRFVESSSNGTAERVRRRRRRRAPNITPEQLRAMVGLKEKGLPNRIIARRFGLSRSGAGNAIRRALKKKGA